MGWFNKTDDKKENFSIPEIPRLPDLPELPRLDNMDDSEKLPQLPSFPSTNLGNKFSQSAIKEAVTGRREVIEDNADDFEDQMMLMSSKREMSMTRDIENVPRVFKEAANVVKNAEPVFVRIDKFEQSLKVFEKAKAKVMDIEKMLRDIKKLKEKEDEELSNWEKEIQTTKEQIERVDKELFSKIQ
jgi:hypothetical protein